MDLLADHSFQAAVASHKILLVGVGGIGCEFLKQLVVSPFREVEIVDLDTIEMSNLNRQFYFRTQHVGKSKAKVAAEIVSKLNPELRIVAHQKNIMDSQFDIGYFAGFKVVVLALDNEEARSYVNKMCMITNTLILEAGTHGFLGQAMILKRSVTRCYDCYPRDKPKTFQVCTLRTLPDKPIHCLVWAKHLFSLIFGANTDENLLVDVWQHGDMYKDRQDEVALKTDEERKQETWSMIQDILGKVFRDLIEELRVSNPKKFEEVRLINEEILNRALQPQYLEAANKDQDPDTTHNVELYVANFLVAGQGLLLPRLYKLETVEFEKDDDVHIRFAIAASNLRGYCFNIPFVTEFSGKSDIGRIIPAIASSNSMVAALQIIELTKYLWKEHHYLQCQLSGKTPDPVTLAFDSFGNKESFIQGVGDNRIKSSTPLEPNPTCSSCRLSNIFYWEANFDTILLKTLVEKIAVLAKTEEFSIFLGSDIVYEQAAYLEEDEIELYQRKVSLKCREFCASQQMKLTFDPDGGQKGSVFIKHNPALETEVNELWHVGNPAEKTDFERFLIESNKKPKVAKPAPKVTLPPKFDSETLDCLSESETSQIIEEGAAADSNQAPPSFTKKNGQNGTTAVVLDTRMEIEDLDSPKAELVVETDERTFAGSHISGLGAPCNSRLTPYEGHINEVPGSKRSLEKAESQKQSTHLEGRVTQELDRPNQTSDIQAEDEPQDHLPTGAGEAALKKLKTS